MILKHSLISALCDAPDAAAGEVPASVPVQTTPNFTPRSTNTSTAAKPVVSAAPPADALKGNFSVSDDEAADVLGETPAEATPPVEKKVVQFEAAVKPKAEKPIAEVPPQKKTDTPVKPAKEEKAPVEEQKEEGPWLLKLADKNKTQRDYSGFTQEEVKVLKSMSNEAFNYVAPFLKRKQELEKLKESTFLQHPMGYTLHPEYQKAQASAVYARTEADAWMQELVKIEEGKEWTPLVGIDPKTGKFVYGEPRQPTIQDKEQVRIAMNRCLQAEEQANQQVRGIPQQFQQVVQQDLQNINAERARRFDWVAKPELMDHELEIDGVGNKKISDIRRDFISLFPAYHQNTVGVEVAADLFVAMQIYAQQLKAANAGKAVAETLKEEATRVEPSSSARAKKQASKFGVTEFSLDGLPE